MSPANHWKLGLFVVTCMIIGLGTVAFVGAKHFEREVEPVHFFFDEPVDGLTVGSEVRFRGIPIGSVREIGLAPDRIHVKVRADVDVATLEQLGLRGYEESGGTMRETLRASGLRSFLETNLLTGVALINSDFFPQHRGEMPEYPFEVPPRTIPTVPSVLKGIMADVEATLEGLRTDLPRTVEKIQHLIERLDSSLRELRLAEVSSEFRETLEALRAGLAELDLAATTERGQRVLGELETTLTETRQLVGTLSAEGGDFQQLLATYRQLGDDLRHSLDDIDLAATSSALERTLEVIARAGEDVGGLSGDLRRDLDVVLRTFESIQRLAELLERDPGALLHGREAGRSPLEKGSER